jgi:hypothetical protein
MQAIFDEAVQGQEVRTDTQNTEEVYLGTQDDLTRNIHGLAAVADLDGDEIGYLVGAVAAIKRKR